MTVAFPAYLYLYLYIQRTLLRYILDCVYITPWNVLMRMLFKTLISYITNKISDIPIEIRNGMNFHSSCVTCMIQSVSCYSIHVLDQI